MWVRINPRLPLGCSIPLAIIRSADPDEILGKHSQVEVMEHHCPRQLNALYRR
jgi:hypothetical protein